MISHSFAIRPVFLAIPFGLILRRTPRPRLAPPLAAPSKVTFWPPIRVSKPPAAALALPPLIPAEVTCGRPQ